MRQPPRFAPFDPQAWSPYKQNRCSLRRPRPDELKVSSADRRESWLTQFITRGRLWKVLEGQRVCRALHDKLPFLVRVMPFANLPSFAFLMDRCSVSHRWEVNRATVLKRKSILCMTALSKRATSHPYPPTQTHILSLSLSSLVTFFFLYQEHRIMLHKRHSHASRGSNVRKLMSTDAKRQSTQNCSHDAQLNTRPRITTAFHSSTTDISK